MPSSRLAGATLCLAAVAVARSAHAQTPAVTVGGVAYAQYYYQLKDTATHVNNFDVTRAYLNVIGRFDQVGTRVTADIYRSADGSLAYRLKYAYATYTPKGSPLTFKLGQIHTAWLDWEEALWDYRMQGTMALERGDLITPLSYVSSSDFGAGVDGKWGPDRVNGQLAVVNGENYNRSPGDRNKDFMGRLSVRVMKTDDSSRVGGLRLTTYGQLGKPTSGVTRNRLLGMLSYRSRRLTLAAEVAATKDSVSTPVLRSRTGRVVSVFGVVRVPDSKVAVLGRIDVTDPNTATPGNRQTRVIAGASYQLSPNLRLLGDLDHVSYEGGTPTPALEAVRSQALFQVQFTF
ncbi:MAG: porin [Gemmatimonadetes bacterium]|nr:porin [Gemmatimonadota bacterium]